MWHDEVPLLLMDLYLDVMVPCVSTFSIVDYTVDISVPWLKSEYSVRYYIDFCYSF